MKPMKTELADALQSALGTASRRRRRVALDQIRLHQGAHEQAWASRPGSARRLLDALTILVDRGAIETPSTRALWNDSVEPALPHWVYVVPDPVASGGLTEAASGRVAWAPGIADGISEWLSTTHPAPPMRMALEQINDWLLKNFFGTPDIVAREERSLTIFNDEKRLANLERTSLFGKRYLTPALLAYERPVAPLRAARLASEGSLLIVENQSSFDSAWRSLRQDPGPFSALAFGNGWEAVSVASLESLPEFLGLKSPPDAVWYLGDLDLDGLDIPTTLTAAVAEASIPAPRPLTVAYQSMLTRSDVRRSTGRAAPTDAAIARVVRWLPAHLIDLASDLLAGGDRIPQETLDRSWWGEADWRTL